MKPLRKSRKYQRRLSRRTRTKNNNRPNVNANANANAKHKIHSCEKSTQQSPIKKSIIVENFIEMLNTVKLYHWNTHSFSQHKATDELYQRLNDHVDKFVEVLLGKKEDRVKQLHSKTHLVNNKSQSGFKDQIYQYREYLIQMDKCLDPQRDTDLLNIRDEILGDINQLLYLLTLNK
jgi:DNA-binding ferritin-like protein